MPVYHTGTKNDSDFTIYRSLRPDRDIRYNLVLLENDLRGAKRKIGFTWAFVGVEVLFLLF